MKTKKLISVVLALTMICSMFMSAVPVSAAEGEHTHAICGEDTCVTDHDLDGSEDGVEVVEYTALSEALKAAGAYDEATGTYAGHYETEEYSSYGYAETVYNGYLDDGNYYLDTDITLSSIFYIGGNVNLCLNGHKLAMADGVTGTVIHNFEEAIVLNLADCNGDNGSYGFTQGEQNWELSDSGEHTVTGGVITGGNYRSNNVGFTGNGINLYTSASNGVTFNMYGGNIVGNNAGEYNGGGITIDNGVMNLYGGTIQGNYAEQFGGGIGLFAYGSTIYGGLIAYNKNPSDNHAAGVHTDRKLTMLGGEIRNNFGNGVTMRKWSGDDNGFYMVGGSITGNTGYGICNGIHVADSPNIHLGGDSSKTIQITNNDTNNIKVSSGYTIAVNELAEDSAIGIITETAPVTGSPVTLSTTGASYAKNFTSDNADYKVAASGEGLVLKVKDTTLRNVTITEGIENGTVASDKTTAMEDEVVTLTVSPTDGYVVDTLTVTDENNNAIEAVVDEQDAKKYTFTMPAAAVTVNAAFKIKTYSIDLSKSFEGGTVTADVTEAAEGATVTLTVTPDEFWKFESLSVVDDSTGNPIYSAPSAEGVALLAAEETHSFTMPASTVTVDAKFALDTAFTVKAAVSGTTPVEDRDTADTDMDVYSGDTVEIDVVVSGSDYTNADWTLVYDYSKFKYVETKKNDAYGTLGSYNLDETRVDGGILKGAISGVAGNDKKADEFENGAAVITYVFEALPQSKEVTGKFAITDAHANTYAMAGNQNNTPALTENVDVTILLVEDNDNDETTTPAGTFEDKTVTYNALEQSGNEFVLDTDFADATVTYAVYNDGGTIGDMDIDGNVDSDDIEAANLTFRTGLPAWTSVGSYTYYARVSGDGLATIYDSAVLTIEPATLTPSANFAVDPDVNKVTIIPVLEGVLDNSHNGQVTVKYTDAEGNPQTETLNASDFKYDGESTSVYNGTIEVPAQASGTFTVELTYTAGTDDNYTGGTNTASVDVDKITFADTAALEAAITSVFPYDSTDHKVVVDEAALAEITDGTWTATTIVDAYDETISDPTVKNVGDEKLVKVVFTDSTGVYNDVVVYVVLKVTPADVRITIDNKTKAVGEDDPAFTYTLEVLDEDGNVVKTNELYSAEDLEALALELTREPGEAAGTYTITATYVPNANYNVTIENGKLEIGAPSTDGPNADVKIEVVDLSKGGASTGDETPDYIAGKRLILVYTNLDKAYYGYGDNAETAERMFDVTAAGYMYVDNDYEAGTYNGDGITYDHVYGIVVDSIGGAGEVPADYEDDYMKKVFFLGSDAADAPENIVYDANINLTNELDINDYSMNNGIYNNGYDRTTYIRSILKADYNHDKVVNTDDSLAVKGVVDPAVAAR